MTDYDTPSEPRRDYDPNHPGARETAARVAEAAKDAYGDLRDEAVEEARQTLHGAREQAGDYAEAQRVAVADGVQAVAEALRSGGDALQSEGRDMLAGIWQRGAHGAQDLARRLQNRSVSDLYHEAQNYARRQPGVSFGGAMAAGFLLARLLKSDAPPRPARPPANSGGEPAARTREVQDTGAATPAAHVSET